MEDKNGPAFTNRVDHPEKDAVKLFGGVVILAVLAIIVGLITKDGRNFLLGLVNPNDTVGVTFNINTENPQSVSKNLYGSSSAQYFDLFDWGGDTDMQNLVSELGTPLLRFPSGGNTKWYHFKAPTNAASVLTPEEISNLTDDNEIRGYGNIERDRVEADEEIGGVGYQDEIYDFIGQPGDDPNKSGQAKQNAEPRNYIHDFAEMANDLDAGVLFVMNIKNNTPAEVAEQVQFLVDEGVNIVGVEVGNEQYSKSNFYLPGNPAVMGPTAVTNYLTHAAAYKTAVKQVLPNVPFAVTAAPKKSFGETEGVEGGGFDADGDFNSQWNIALASQMDAYGYDDYVFHYYSGFDDCTTIPTEAANVNEWFDCGISELADIFGDTDSKSFPKLLDYYADLFGDDKGMWFTEWNVNQDPNKTDAIFGNTMLHAIHTTNILNALVNSNSEHNGFIKFSTYHTMGTEGVKNAMISPRKGGELLDEFPSSASHPNRRASYFSFLTMKDIFWSEMDKVSITSEFDNDPGIMFVNAFKDGDTYVIHIANTTAKTVTLKNININEKTINTESTEADYYFVEGSSIKASYGKSRFEDNPVDQISTLEGSGMLNTLLLPGFSVGYIKIENPTFIVVEETEDPDEDNDCGPIDSFFGGCGNNETEQTDTKSPRITMVSPANKATVLGEIIEIKVEASDASGIAKVDFYQGQTLIGSDTSAPYKYGWSTVALTPGMYSLRAVAYDTAGNFSTVDIKVRK
jgi:hypothetical protein